jgi:hypothetical protein
MDADQRSLGMRFPGSVFRRHSRSVAKTEAMVAQSEPSALMIRTQPATPAEDAFRSGISRSSEHPGKLFTSQSPVQNSRLKARGLIEREQIRQRIVT